MNKYRIAIFHKAGKVELKFAERLEDVLDAFGKEDVVGLYIGRDAKTSSKRGTNKS